MYVHAEPIITEVSGPGVPEAGPGEEDGRTVVVSSVGSPPERVR
jgi:hypothetical protein